uniref:antileukoproteinase n=1 Tax=Podarcis muralis TaxID=64176 RepID=UPI00109EF825|nr:antileukoproteinase [Podarcis muralis]
MKTLVTFALVGLLALWLPFTACQKTPKGKPGICPIDRCRCTGPQPDECRDDYICLGQKKCCYSCCAMRCVDPEFRNVEYATCIWCRKTKRREAWKLSSHNCFMLDPPYKCDVDYDCPKNKKCCEGICGRDCYLAIFVPSTNVN